MKIAFNVARFGLANRNSMCTPGRRTAREEAAKGEQGKVTRSEVARVHREKDEAEKVAGKELVEVARAEVRPRE